MRTDIDTAKEKIIAQLQLGVPRASICAEFKCKHTTLSKRLKEWGFEYLNNQPGRGKPKYAKRKPLIYHLTVDSQVPTYHLKLRLWRDGLKPKFCEECGWAKRAEDGRLPLELHHINGDSFDNRLENLQILCPNCHSLKANHRGLSKGKAGKEALRLENGASREFAGVA